VTRRNFHVAVIGGGIGGLCLAQRLRKANISVSVYERDEAATIRAQGYRIHIDPQGSRALHESLPEHLWNTFEASCGVFHDGFTVITDQLCERQRRPLHAAATGVIERHRSVNRVILRAVLQTGLEDILHCGKRFLRYEEDPSGPVVAHFQDGSCAVADILVAADGVHSNVRKQYLPDAEPTDTGVIGIRGKVLLTAEVSALAPSQLVEGPVMITPPEPCSLFMVMWKQLPRVESAVPSLQLEKLSGVNEDYLILAMGGRPAYFAIPTDTTSVNKALLKEVLRRTVSGWHSDLRRLVEMIDDDEISLNKFYSSPNVAAWKPTQITLLGDAIHSMTPYRGIGGNIALRDAALLGLRLEEARRGGKSVIAAITEYEAAMHRYGFAAVQDSLRAMEQFTKKPAESAR
jgi:2-polyprenyl-6-methoxyphenol hydroxylase-like FAD-dependent oxidoreductase